ncbi:MAG: pyridoxal-phosphate dependent enzyme [Phycisphaerales bacterium]|nr:MAG: pyridoxal-phosphate dependent enzyme [Phycisphaerales bacterium]
MSGYAATLEDVRRAHGRIHRFVHRTPVLTCVSIDRIAGRRLFFKCENFQKVGAFKFRGACNAILQLPQAACGRGVVTHSSGNHAQAVALAASVQGIAAHVVMPISAAAVKRRAVEEYGAAVYPCEPTLAARERVAAEVAERTGATFIPPFDHPHVIAGQGTAALELLEAVPQLDAIVAPVGGGGLLSGTCIAARGIDPAIRVFAGEPAGADDAARSLAAGRLIPQTAPNTIADGLLTSLGEYTWPIIRDHVAGIITVSDDEIRAAMRLVWERMKIVIEPSAAVAVAAVLSSQFPRDSPARRVGIILSGGNVDLG